MEAFPTQHERTAATALLLLSFSCCKEEQSPSDSCSSVLTSDDSRAEIRADLLNVLAFVACYNEIKPKILKKRRSKNYRISDCRKIFSGERIKMIQPESREEALVPSRGSSTVFSAPIVLRLRVDRRKSNEEMIRRKKVGSACTSSMKRRGKAILKFLSVSCASETRIREALGDSPDTSKALRMLLKFEEVQRSGAGGRKRSVPLYVLSMIGEKTTYGELQTTDHSMDRLYGVMQVQWVPAILVRLSTCTAPHKQSVVGSPFEVAGQCSDVQSA